MKPASILTVFEIDVFRRQVIVFYGDRRFIYDRRAGRALSDFGFDKKQIHDLREAFQYGSEQAPTATGLTITIEDGGPIIVWTYGPDRPVIAHELTHVADSVMGYAGVSNDTEVRAALVDLCVRKVETILQE